MKFREKLKLGINAKCQSCGNTVGGGFTSNFSTWLFHQQICQCRSAASRVDLVVDPAAQKSGVQVPEGQFDLGDRFEIVGMIGEGGMGTVYKAIDKELNTTVAVKVLRLALVSDEVAKKRFHQEADAVKRLNHPNLVAVLDVGNTQSGVPFIVHEYVDGIDLAAYIRRRGHLSATESMQLLSQMAQAVAHAHAHDIIHRDLKPSNVLLFQAADGKQHVKIVDFGIAKATSPDEQSGQLTQTGEVFGSPAYMSPEQCLGEAVDVRSDIYSLGCIAYEMLTGRNPFASESPVKTILKHVEQQPEAFEIEFSKLKIPTQVETVVFKCLEKDPKRRFKSASDLEIELIHGAPAPALKRLSAFVIDAGVVLFLAAVTMSITDRIESLQIEGTLILCFVIAAYFSIAEGLFGRTLGKKHSGLITIDSKGRRQGFLRALFRWLMIMAVPLTLCWGTTISEMLLNINGNPFTFDTMWAVYGTCALGVVVLVLMAQIFLSKKKQCSLDKIFDRFVVRCPAVRNTTAGGVSSGQLAIGLMSAVLLVWLPMLEKTLEKEGVKRGVLHMADVYYATRDVPEGQTIPAKAIVKRSILERKVPQDAIRAADEAVEKHAKYGISAGQIVSKHDIEEANKEKSDADYQTIKEDNNTPAKKPTEVRGSLLDELKKSKDKGGPIK